MVVSTVRVSPLMAQLQSSNAGVLDHALYTASVVTANEKNIWLHCMRFLRLRATWTDGVHGSWLNIALISPYSDGFSELRLKLAEGQLQLPMLRAL